jgi:hypothetical protein
MAPFFILAPRIGRISQLFGKRGRGLCHRANKAIQYLVRVIGNEVHYPWLYRSCPFITPELTSSLLARLFPNPVKSPPT